MVEGLLHLDEVTIERAMFSWEPGQPLFLWPWRWKKCKRESLLRPSDDKVPRGSGYLCGWDCVSSFQRHSPGTKERKLRQRLSVVWAVPWTLFLQAEGWRVLFPSPKPVGVGLQQHLRKTWHVWLQLRDALPGVNGPRGIWRLQAVPLGRRHGAEEGRESMAAVRINTDSSLRVGRCYLTLGDGMRTCSSNISQEPLKRILPKMVACGKSTSL